MPAALPAALPKPAAIPAALPAALPCSPTHGSPAACPTHLSSPSHVSTSFSSPPAGPPPGPMGPPPGAQPPPDLGSKVDSKMDAATRRKAELDAKMAQRQKEGLRSPWAPVRQENEERRANAKARAAVRRP